jgi:hypothetical protein
MANVSRIKGFIPVKHNTGAPYNGQGNLYYVASAADEIFVGDIVKLSGSGDASGIPGCDLAAAGNTPVGVVVGIVNPKLDPDGRMTGGSIALDLPTCAQIAAGTAGYVLVEDSPDIIMEVEADTTATFAVTDIGLNADLIVLANSLTRTAATTTSTAAINSTTKLGTSTLVFNVRGFVKRPDNEVGASTKLLVGFNVHQFKSVGTAGV